MAWVTTFNSTDADGRRVEYQQDKRSGDSWAESRARVTVAGRVVCTGWSSDGRTYETYVKCQGGEVHPE